MKSQIKNRSILSAQIVTALNLFIAALFSLVALINPSSLLPSGAVTTEASQLFALYYAARSIPIAVVGIWAIVKRDVPIIVVIGTLAGVVQLVDAGIGIYRHDIFKTIGPAVLGLVQLLVLYPLYRKSSSLDSD